MPHVRIKHRNVANGDKIDTAKEKRMYAIQNAEKYFLVKILSNFISKTEQNAKSLFNHCSKPAWTSPIHEPIGYTNTPIKHYQFTKCLHDISSNEKCSNCTTHEAHCLRATTIQLMNNARLDLRHIMHKNGHKNEVSVRSSNCNSSMQQKKTKSAIQLLLWVSQNPRFLILNRAQ